ncbi:MAG: TonB-dependent receptor [Pseudomonadales bacterium]|nr:TonB-dependent receptor [Pseudomonadales bacterium]
MRKIGVDSVMLAILISGALLPGQSEAVTNVGSSKGLYLEEVVVTARKREESLQDTPIAISAFTGDNMEARGSFTIDDIEKYAPNVTFQNNPSFGGSSNSAAIYIRGIGQKDFLATIEPGVGLYVDGVYVARSVGGILNLGDIAQVEVLRGPQGTLFGRNTIGGAVSVTLNKPEAEFGGSVELLVGEDDRIQTRGVLNVPLADNFFSRYSVFTHKRDGYVERLDGKDLGDDDEISARAAFLWMISDSFDANLSFDYTKSSENGPALSHLSYFFDPTALTFLHNSLTPGCGAPTGDLGNPACINDAQYNLGKDYTAGTAPSYSDTDLFGVNLTLDWEVSDSLQIKSITAYRDLDSEFARDLDKSPHDVNSTYDNFTQNQFSQEIQFLGDTFDEQLNWILGIYYFSESAENQNDLFFPMLSFRSGGDVENESWAVFAQGTYDLTDQLSITLGVRYTEDTKEFKPDQYILSAAPFFGLPVGLRVLPNETAEETFEDVTPMVSLTYRWTETLMTYLSYSEGYKSGGYTQRVFPPLPEIPSFDPEYVEVYEVGFKYEDLEKGYRLNGAAFYSDYSDLQIQTFIGIAPITKNAAEASITGLELEFVYTPTETWLLEGSIGWIDAEFEKVGSTATEISKNSEFERVPEWTASLGISKEIGSERYGTFKPRVDWSYRSEFFNDALNTPIIEQDAYSVVNASIAWSAPNEKLKVVLGIDNVFDEDYMITGIYGVAQGTAEAVFDRGRRWYLRANYSF